jgi:hypothetical protein
MLRASTAFSCPRTVPVFGRPSHSLAAVVIQGSAEPFATSYRTRSSAITLDVIDQTILETLMIAFEMIVLRELGHRFAKMSLA